MNKPLLRISAWPPALYLVLLLFLCSCEKEEASPGHTQVCRPSVIYNVSYPNQYQTYQYDNQNRVAQTTEFVKGKESRAYLYEYNSLGQVEKISIRDESLNVQSAYPDKIYVIYTFEYNSLGQVSKYYAKNPWLPHPFDLNETVCEYDQEGNRTKTITTSSDTAISVHTSVYTYKDGNCIKSVYSSSTSILATVLYQFDTGKENKLLKFNQVYDLVNLIGPSANRNMVESAIETYDQYQLSIKHNYEYNKDGLPTKVSHLWENATNSTVIVDVMEYVCQ